MKNTISMRMLQEISRDFSSGRPIWGLLRCNEYLAPTDPLSMAFRKKAKIQLSCKELSICQQQACKVLFSGYTVQEMSKESLEELLDLDSKTSRIPGSRSLPTPRRRRGLRIINQRKELRTSNKLRIS